MLLSSGYDKLKGKDINIVGTPHVHPLTIALYAKVLNMPVVSSEPV